MTDQTKKSYSSPQEDVSRRSLVAALAGLGASALAGCGSEPDGSLRFEETGQASAAASGATVGWVDAVADLRAMPATPAYAVVIAKGYSTAGDGGGGEFHWTSDTTTADDGGLTFVPTAGPRTGCWKRLVAQHINVKWFGARGDDATDDTLALQRAITACGTSAGGNIDPASTTAPRIALFPPGRYRTLSTLYVRGSFVVLAGCGNASIIAPEGSFDSLVLQSLPAGSYLYGNRLLDLMFDEIGKTGGRTVYGERLAESL